MNESFEMRAAREAFDALKQAEREVEARAVNLRKALQVLAPKPSGRRGDLQTVPLFDGHIAEFIFDWWAPEQRYKWVLRLWR